LEPGSSIFIFIRVVFVVQTCLQVDEDGESYWVFESRDVRLPVILLSRCLLFSAFQTGKPCGFKVFFSASLFACDNKYLSCRMFWVRPSSFDRFIFDPFSCPDCALPVPYSMGSTLDCIALETWFCVRSINFHHLTSIDQPFQLHSHCPTCFGVQRDKCYWFHLCVRSS
jgi:hypothetical protein